MGTWGAGNFDSDGALDYLGDHIDSLVEKINECFEAGAGLDEEGESELMPTVELLVILAEQCPAAPPKPEEVKTWKKRYLKTYDSEIDDLDPQEGFKEERRAVIEQTFDRLINKAAAFYDRTK